MMENADVEDEIVRCQELQALDEIGLDAEIRIALRLDQPAHAAQRLVLPQAIEFGLDRLALFERQGRDHAGQSLVLLSDAVDPGGLVEMLRQVDIDFDKDEAVDLDRRGRFYEIRGKHLPVERRRILRPGITEAFRVRQMHMAVDDRKFRHSLPPSSGVTIAIARETRHRRRACVR